MDKQSLPSHHKDGTGGIRAVPLVGLAGQQVVCKTFVPGLKASQHQVSADTFLLVLDGQLDITLGEETSRFVAGDYIVIPANTTHTLLCLETARLLLVSS